MEDLLRYSKDLWSEWEIRQEIAKHGEQDYERIPETEKRYLQHLDHKEYYYFRRKDTKMDNRTPLERANDYMKLAMEALQEPTMAKSRENSLAVTNLEQAMMWNNKDRTIRGELTPYPTHVQSEE